VVDEPVDEGGGDHGVAEDLAPLLEAAIRGDGDRAALVAARDEREEQVGGLTLENVGAARAGSGQAVRSVPGATDASHTPRHEPLRDVAVRLNRDRTLPQIGGRRPLARTSLRGRVFNDRVACRFGRFGRANSRPSAHDHAPNRHKPGSSPAHGGGARKICLTARRVPRRRADDRVGLANRGERGPRRRPLGRQRC
jgi:hypothetical protein